MKPPPFDYVRVDTVAQALAILTEYREQVSVLAGGQSLMAMLNMRLLSPQVVLDITRIEALKHISIEQGWLQVGAAVTQSQLAAWPSIDTCVPLLALALPWVGHYQTRSRGTVCGSIAHADPSSELPLCLRTLAGTVVLASEDGQRCVDAAQFQQGLLSTAREANELIVAVRFPVATPGDGYGFQEFAVRHGDFALMASAVHSSPTQLRLGFAGCGDRPVVLALNAEQRADVNAVVEEFLHRADVDEDLHASAAYRRRLAMMLVQDALQQASQ